MLARPILFKSASDPTNTLGLGVMTGFQDWRVKTEKNMIPKLTGTYSLNNYLSSFINNDCVIMADASQHRLNQIFKIDKLSQKVDEHGKGTIDIEAHHIAGELIKNSIAHDIFLVNASPQKLWDTLMTNLTASDFKKFHFHTDIVSVANISIQWKEVTTLQDILFGDSNSSTDSFTKLWNGQWYFDNYDIYFLQKIGTGDKLSITYGQNLKTLSQDLSIQNTYTAVQGYASKKEEYTPTTTITITTTENKHTDQPKGPTHPVNGDWGPVIKYAAKVMGVTCDDDYVAKIKNMIQGESSGNEKAVNNWDANAQAGHPSLGLLQFVQGTFDRYKVKPYTNIWAGFDQLCALFNMSDWKSQVNSWQKVRAWSPNGKQRMDEVKNTSAIQISWGWPFPSVGEGKFAGGQLFGINPGGEFRTNNFHDGLDFGNIDHPGSEVHAIHDGKVTIIGTDSYIGWHVVTHSNDGYDIVYQEAFSNRGNIKVSQGQEIKTGDVIGIRDTNHVHIGVTKKSWVEGYNGHSFDPNWGWLDPLKLIKDGSKPGELVVSQKTVEIGQECDIGLVQYIGSGRVATYSSPIDKRTSGQYIKPGQHIRIIRKYTGNGTDWYKITDNNWINADFINVNNGSKYLFNNIQGKGHIKWDESVKIPSLEVFERTLKTKYLYSKIPVHLYPNVNSPTESSLDTSSNKKIIYRTKDDDGIDWYGLGNKQWINSQNLVLGAYVYQSAKGIGKTNKTANIFAEPGNSNIGTVNRNTECKVFMIAKNQGKTWYNIGGQRWIDSQDISFTTTPLPIAEVVNGKDLPPNYTDKLTVYDSPAWDRKVNGKYVGKNELVNITGQANSDNQVWYRVEKGWINGKYVDFSQKGDVKPYDPKAKSIPNNDDNAIVLKEVYLKAPNADKFENEKILKHDFSEYNINSSDQLKGLVQSYIYDKRVGEVEVNLTIDFYQMKNELAQLKSCDVGYEASVFFKKLDINEATEITSLEWNGPKQRIENVHLGKKEETLRDTMNQFLAVADANSQKNASESASSSASSNAEALNEVKAKVNKQLDDFKVDWEAYKKNVPTQTDFQNQLQAMQTNLSKSMEEKFQELEERIKNDKSDNSGSKQEK